MGRRGLPEQGFPKPRVEVSRSGICVLGVRTTMAGEGTACTRGRGGKEQRTSLLILGC